MFILLCGASSMVGGLFYVFMVFAGCPTQKINIKTLKNFKQTGYADCLLESNQHNLYDIPLLCLQYCTPDDGQSNCPKHVEFYS